ncbi:hypothetical protein ADL01_21495, partial [Streptomyces sp. NRRL WC-3618]
MSNRRDGNVRTADAAKDVPPGGTPTSPPAPPWTWAPGPATRLADTGSFDTTPYMVGGTFC